MSFPGKTTDDLINIMRAGAGMRIDVLGRTTDELMQIAAAAKSRGGSNSPSWECRFTIPAILCVLGVRDRVT